MNDLYSTLDSLSECGKTLQEIAAKLKATLTPTYHEVPTEDVDFKPTFIEVRQKASEMSHSGFKDDVKALLTRYGIAKLSDLKEEQYAAFMKDLEALK